jgi:hypothetical protein
MHDYTQLDYSHAKAAQPREPITGRPQPAPQQRCQHSHAPALGIASRRQGGLPSPSRPSSFSFFLFFSLLDLLDRRPGGLFQSEAAGARTNEPERKGRKRPALSDDLMGLLAVPEHHFSLSLLFREDGQVRPG